MNAENIRSIIKNYISTEDEVFTQIADDFLLKVKTELVSKIAEGTAITLFGSNGFCISVSSINSNFSSFKFVLMSWTLQHGKTLHDYDLITYEQYIEKTNLKALPPATREPELAGFQNEDILLLKPFVKALQKKGFECYADPDNFELIVTCDI